MKRRPFTVMRALGIFLGLLFILTAPLVAKGDGWPFIGRIGQIAVTVTLGVIFIAYGVTGLSSIPKVSARSRRLLNVTVSGVAYLTCGIYLLFIRQGGVISQIIGSVLILFAATAIWAWYAICKSTPAA